VGVQPGPGSGRFQKDFVAREVDSLPWRRQRYACICFGRVCKGYGGRYRCWRNERQCESAEKAVLDERDGARGEEDGTGSECIEE
jgi:hypothetical protein